MYFRRFYDEQLAQASYLIGCQATDEAIVIDPNRLVDQYLTAAEAEGLRIVAVAETHIHADFVSGLRELAARTQARMFVSGCGPADWQYRFRTDPNVTVLASGDRIGVGNVRLEAIHTPGHTPEHVVYLVTDTAGATDPMGIVTGDFVFVGDVGRPDLLEKAAHQANTAESSARALYRSLQWFRTLPDHLQIWPGHGAGSACGKGLGAVPQSTVGYERRFNWAFGPTNEADFVRQVLAGQPEPPAYFGRMKQVNRDGPAVLGSIPRPPAGDPAAVPALVASGAFVVDTRATAEYAAGHIPGTVNVPWSRSFSSYAGSVLPPDRDFHLVVGGGAEVANAIAAQLVSIGLERIAGYWGLEALDAWRQAGRPIGRIRQVSAAELAAQPSGRTFVLDVRNRSEWDGGHLPGAHLVPLAELTARLGEIPRDRDVVVHCQGGGRSSIAASVLAAHGWPEVANLIGGFSAWVASGGKSER